MATTITLPDWDYITPGTDDPDDRGVYVMHVRSGYHSQSMAIIGWRDLDRDWYWEADGRPLIGEERADALGIGTSLAELGARGTAGSVEHAKAQAEHALTEFVAYVEAQIVPDVVPSR